MMRFAAFLLGTVFFFSFISSSNPLWGGVSWGAQIQKSIDESLLYFPSKPGSRWSYYGSVVDQVQRVANYVNVTTISGTTIKNGVTVKIFSESNQANSGPADSFFVIDQTGITYYGSSPTTPFEKQIVPYRVVSFPISLHASYPQIDKRGLSFGRDLDEDGKDEQADVISQMNVLGFETVSVPGGVFNGCLKLEGVMNLYVTLSGSHKIVQMVDTTTNWFAPGVGLIKGTERTDFPSINGGPAQSTIITEELGSFSEENVTPHKE
jgi:hypothetical protein